jgi:hypothetical protein
MPAAKSREASPRIRQTAGSATVRKEGPTRQGAIADTAGNRKVESSQLNLRSSRTFLSSVSDLQLPQYTSEKRTKDGAQRQASSVHFGETRRARPSLPPPPATIAPYMVKRYAFESLAQRGRNTGDHAANPQYSDRELRCPSSRLFNSIVSLRQWCHRRFGGRPRWRPLG